MIQTALSRACFVVSISIAWVADGQEPVDRFFREYDENQDGKVTLQEFGGEPEKFAIIDHDQNGAVDKTELDSSQGWYAQTRSLQTLNQALIQRLTQIEVANQDLKTRVNELTAVNSQFVAVKASLDSATNEIFALKQETQKLTNANQTLSAESAAISGENRVLDSQVQLLVADNASLKATKGTIVSIRNGIAGLSVIVALIALLSAYRSGLRQLWTTPFLEFTDRYDTLYNSLPHEVRQRDSQYRFKGVATEKNAKDSIARFFYFFWVQTRAQNTVKFLDDVTWTQWRNSMKKNFCVPAVCQEWCKHREHYIVKEPSTMLVAFWWRIRGWKTGPQTPFVKMFDEFAAEYHGDDWQARMHVIPEAAEVARSSMIDSLHVPLVDHEETLKSATNAAVETHVEAVMEHARLAQDALRTAAVPGQATSEAINAQIDGFRQIDEEKDKVLESLKKTHESTIDNHRNTVSSLREDLWQAIHDKWDETRRELMKIADSLVAEVEKTLSAEKDAAIVTINQLKEGVLARISQASP